MIIFGLYDPEKKRVEKANKFYNQLKDILN